MSCQRERSECWRGRGTRTRAMFRRSQNRALMRGGRT
jgi:hypothetical protein